MLRKPVSTLGMLLIMVGSAACSLRQADLTPTMAVEATATASGDAVESASTEQQASGGYMPPGTSERIEDWWGIIKGTEAGAQYDDCFERRDLGQTILFGIDSMDPGIRSQIEALRDSGKIVHLSGTLFSNAPDCNGSQVQVDRIEVEG